MYEQGFAFEQWVVTPADSVVSGPHGETRLEPRVMAVLVQLAVNSGEVVSRNDLIDTVWGGAVVGDEVLSRCIYQVRQALGESSRDPHFIQTVPKRGYRLNATIVDLAESENEARTEAWQHGSPYRGLQAFDLEHAPVFFGRTRASFEALTALKHQASLGKAFLLLLGSSGVGKSSLAQAGVLHNLLHGPGPEHWFAEVFRPGSSTAGPSAALVEAICRSASLGPFHSGDCDDLIAKLSEKLAVHDRIAVVVDQLEEVFSAQHISDEQRQAFFDAMEKLAMSGHCWIIATLRSDFYSHCVSYPALMRLKKGGGQYDVLPMRSGEIRQAIQMPAMAAGLRFEGDAGKGEKLDDILHDETVRQPRLLPLLEFTLHALYDARSSDGLLTTDAYRALGGIEGSLARRAERIFADLPKSQQVELPNVISRLVRIRSNQVLASSFLMSELADENASKLIEAFVSARLFSSELDANGNTRIFVTHEALLTHWPRIRDWVDRNLEMIRVRARVTAAFERWDGEGRRDDMLLPRGKLLDEGAELVSSGDIVVEQGLQEFVKASGERAARRLWLERASVAALAVLTITAGTFAWQASEQRDLALQQSALAERETTAAQETADFLIEIFDSADPSESTGGRLTAQRILNDAVLRLDEGLVEQDALRTRLRGLVARAYKGIGLYGDAEAMLRQADEEAAELAEIDERERLEIRYQLADTMFQRGNLEGAEALHAEVLAERQALFGDNDIDTVSSLAARAHELWRNGSVDEAENLFKQVLAVREEQLGLDHRQVNDIVSSLGTLYYLQGMMTEAEVFYRAASEMAATAYGPRHVSTAIALSNLSLVEADPAEREALLNRSLSIRQEVLGPDHPLVARSEQILADYYWGEGRDEQAAALYRQSIRKLEAAEDQVAVRAHVQNRYAMFLQSRGRHDEAVQIFASAHDGYKGLLGASHRWTLRLHGNLAYATYLNGDKFGSEAMFRNAIEIAQASETASASVAADIQRQLSFMLVDAQDFAAAEQVSSSAVATYPVDADTQAYALAASLGALAEAQLGLGNPEEALVASRRALEMTEDSEDVMRANYELLVAVSLAQVGDCDQGLSIANSVSQTLPADMAVARQKQRLLALVETARASCRNTD